MRSAQQVVHELQVREEVEGVRQEVREVKRESKVEESRSLHEHMWMTWMTKHKTHDLNHGECARCDNVLTNEKKQDKAHSHSGVRVDVLNMEVSDNGHVVIGVGIMQCYHAIMDVVIGVRIMQCYHSIMANSEYSTFDPNYQLVVRLYDLIVTFSCSHLLHTFAPRKHVI